MLWALLALLTWGAWFAVTRLSITRTLSAADITALRLGGGSLVLLPAFLRNWRGIPRRAWAEAVLLSVCWGAPFLLLVSFGIKLTSASNAAAITPTTMPVFAGLFGWLAYGERPTRVRLLGLTVIVAGVALLTTLGGAAHPEWDLRGDAALLTGAALWATYTVRLRRSGLTAVQAATLVSVYSAAVYLPIYLLGGWQNLTRAPARDVWLQVAYQGVLVGGLSLLAFNLAVARLGTSAATAIVSLVPVVATLLAIPILGESPTPITAIAVASVALGVFLSGRPNQAVAA